MGIGEGEGVAATGFRRDVACLIQFNVANIGFIVAAGPREIHFARKRAATPVKGISAFARVDHATGRAFTDINRVIALARFDNHCCVGQGLKGTGVGNGFITVAAGVNHWSRGAG